MFKIVREVRITEPEKTIELYLEQEDDAVCLKGTDANGLHWCILRLNNDGTFYRYISIGENVGIAVDSLGRIVEEDK